MTGQRLRLLAAFVLFAGWLGWLGYAALAKSRGPVVSRAQAAGATSAVVADVTGADKKPAAKVTVVERLTKDGPEAKTEVTVANLPDAAGFAEPGEYLLLLVREGGDTYRLAGLPRSPGYDAAGPPTVYRWSNDVRAQAAKLFP